MGIVWLWRSLGPIPSTDSDNNLELGYGQVGIPDGIFGA